MTCLHADRWSDHHGTLHVGIWACAAEIVANRLFSDGDDPVAANHLDISFIRAGRGVETRMDGRLVHRGHTVGVAEVLGIDDTGRTCVRATVGARR